MAKPIIVEGSQEDLEDLKQFLEQKGVECRYFLRKALDVGDALAIIGFTINIVQLLLNWFKSRRSSGPIVIMLFNGTCRVSLGLGKEKELEELVKKALGEEDIREQKCGDE